MIRSALPALLVSSALLCASCLSLWDPWLQNPSDGSVYQGDMASQTDRGDMATASCNPPQVNGNPPMLAPENPAPISSALHGVWANSACDVWAVGDNGATIHWDGTAWTNRTGATSLTLTRLWAPDAQTLWAIGTDGGNSAAIFHWSGTGWVKDGPGIAAETLNGIWGAGPGDIWTVAGTFSLTSTGKILHYDGTSWTVAPTDYSGQLPGLFGVWGRSANDVWAVGGNGVILHWTGTGMWTTVRTQAFQAFREVWGGSSGPVWAAGSVGFPPMNRLLFKWDGSTWTDATTGPASTSYYAVWGTAPDNAWVVGASGTVIHWNGSSWSQVAGNTAATLFGAGGDAANHLFFVGDSGTVLRSK